jgi:hypothetical protein
MVVKRKKVGNTTITINTKTGRQTTSRRSGNITYSQSNQGHTRSTVTTNHGNGWFDRKTTNWNKKSRKKKSDWDWLFGSSGSATTSNLKATQKAEKKIEEPKAEFVGPIFPSKFYERKTFKQFTLWEWCKWFMYLPFRAMWVMFKVGFTIYVIVTIYNAIAM